MTEKKGNQELENWLATQLNPRIDFNIFDFEHNGLHFAIFRVDATRNMPVSFRGVPYIRIGSYKKTLDEHPERERKIWNRTNLTVFEKEPALERVSETDVLQLLDYPVYFDMLKLPQPDNSKGVIDRFTQDRFIEQTGSAYDITNLGALLFARNLDQFETLSRKAGLFYTKAITAPGPSRSRWAWIMPAGLKD